MAVSRNPVETRMQRKLLKEYIAAEPVEVELQRPIIEKTAAGGLKTTGFTRLPSQTARLVPFKRRLTAITRDTPDGNIIHLEYVLIGHYDMDVQPGDYFEAEGDRFDVISIEPNRAYRTACNITYRGPVT